MDPAHLYTYLAAARARVFDWARPLTPEEYTREFAIGAGSLAAILNHTLVAEWYYVFRILQREVPPTEELVARSRVLPAFPELEAAWNAQAADTRAAVDAVTDWDASISYTVTDDETGALRRVTATPTDIISQLILHEVHHRAQALNILRHLGVKTEDIDYNMLMYRMTEV